jgi:hypothetical protein
MVYIRSFPRSFIAHVYTTRPLDHPVLGHDQSLLFSLIYAAAELPKSNQSQTKRNCHQPHSCESVKAQFLEGNLET